MIREFEQELHFCEENQVPDEYVKVCLTLLLITEMQNKIRGRIHSIRTKWAKVKSKTVAVLARQEPWELSFSLAEGVKWNFYVIIFISC